MKRKILAGLLSLCMMVSLVPTAVFAEEVTPVVCAGVAETECLAEEHIEGCDKYVAPKATEEPAPTETPAEEPVATASLEEETPAPIVEVDTVINDLAELKTAAANGGTYTLGNNITVDEEVNFVKETKIVGDGNATITNTVKKALRIHANVTFEKVNINSTATEGRCVDTRVGKITVNIINCNLTANGSGNTQPITIGGSEGGVVVNVTKSTVAANPSSGYAIINFVPATVTITDSNLSGYNALYIKNGAKNSVYTVTDSTLESLNPHTADTNSFGTVVFEDDATVTVKGGTVKAITTGTQYQSLFGIQKNYPNSVANVKLNDTALVLEGGYACVLGGNFASTSTIVATGKSVEAFAAKVGDKCYTTVEAAVEAAPAGGTVTLLNDVVAEVNATGKVIDLNGKNFKGHVVGTLNVNGGNYIMTEDYIGTLVGANGKFKSTNGVFEIAQDMTTTFVSGEVTLGENWRTLPGQNLVVAEGASFNVPENKEFLLYGEAVVKGTVTVGGTIKLGGKYEWNGQKVTITDATLEAPAGLNVVSGLDGYGVVYSNGVYKLADLITTYDELVAAIAAANNGDVLKLGADITAANIVVINKAITLDGNGYKLTSTISGDDGRAINVSGANGVTIKNLTINASGQRAINIIQKSTNVTIDNVTATASNYTVNVASSASNAIVTINKSDLTGLNVVNVGAAGAKVTVTATALTCNDNNSEEGYSVLALNKDAIGGTITFTGGSITIGGTNAADTVKASNGAENGTVTINGSSDEVDIDVAAVEYGNYYYGLTTIQGAVDLIEAKDHNYNPVKMLRNVEEDIVVKETIVLNTNGKEFKGKVTLADAAAKITSTTDITVVSGVAGYVVSDASGVYTLVECTAHEETVDKVAKAPTCTETGLTEGTICSKCNKVLKEQTTVAATGHSFGSWKTTKGATCARAGEETRTCSCGAAEVRTTAKSSMHGYGADGKCATCGATDPKYVAPVATPAPTAAPTAKPTTAPTATPAPEATPEATPAPEMPKEADTTITKVVAKEEVVEAVKETVTVTEGTATVETETVEAVIEATEEDAPVVLPLAQVTEETAEVVNKAEVATEALKTVAEAEKDVVIELTDVTVMLDAEAVKAITEQADGATIEIRAVKIEKHTLTEKQQATLADKDTVIVVTAQIFSDGEYIGDFKGGKATIMLPFQPEEGKAAEDYAVYFIDDQGDLVPVPAEYVDGHMVFTTVHFSDYVIVYEGEAFGGSAEIVVPEAPAAESSFPVLPVAIVIAIIIIGGVIILMKKKNAAE